jgi:Leucine-rich repeat (LRR) protein
MNGHIPYTIAKLDNLKSVNLSYNSFSGAVSQALAQKEGFNLTMINESGLAFQLEVSSNAKGVLAADE